MGLLSFATLKGKIALWAIIAVALGAFSFYVWNLNKQVDSLQADKIELTTTLNAANDTIKENDRRAEVVDQVTKLGNEERVIIKKEYQSKIDKVDTLVKENKDQPVGPLLKEFFNE